MPQEIGYTDQIDRMTHEMLSHHIIGREQELKDLQASDAPEYRIWGCQVKIAWCYYVLETRGLVSRLPRL